MDFVRVQQLLDDGAFDLGLELIAGEQGLGNKIASSRVQKPGLALSGFTEHIHKDRVQVFGNTEMSYLATLPRERQERVIHALMNLPICVLIVMKNLPIPPIMKEAANAAGAPLLRSRHLSSVFIANVEHFLEEALTATTSVHGVLVDVLGVGIMILGKSGIGKSEAALDLIMKGHRLVADDIIDLKRKSGGAVFGSGYELIRHHMEIRGLGIINIKDLFGVSAVRDRKRVEMVIELVEWDEQREYDRLGVDETKYTVLDTEVPMLTIPVRPGRNLTTIIEVAARNHLLKLQGHHSAKDFKEKLATAIAEGTAPAGPGEDGE